MKQIILYSTLLTAIICLPASATIINIPDDYLTIQQGIDASTDGDTVLVQPGTYMENINFNGHNIVLGSLFLTTGDTTYIAETVIDGNAAGSVVSFESDEDSSAIIIGFTIQGGNASSGGGIYCNGSSPTITNNLVCGNTGSWGSGIHCRYSSPEIACNRITGNHTGYPADAGYGGGISCTYNSNPVIRNNSITENSAGGHYYGDGGGISCYFNSNPSIINNVIAGNFAGGGFYGGLGGGVYLEGLNTLISNNVITGNIVLGGLIPAEGGGVYSWSENTIITNTIIRANTPSEVDGSASITYSDIQGGWEGEGNIDVDPLFRDPDNGDFHLMSTACGDPYDSPCIDAGHPDILDSLLDCSWGLGQLRSDMGAYGGGDSVTVGIDHDEIPVPDEFSISQNYPNPFNATTVIRYALPEPADVVIEIYDILGRKVETLVQGEQPAGYHQAVWDATNFPSGVYFARLEAAGLFKSVRMVLLK